MERLKVKIHNYQRDGIRHLQKHKYAGLFYDPGLGKTLTALLSFELLRRTGQAKKMLVVAPLRVAKTVWAQEIDKWEQTHHLKAVVLHGKWKDDLLKQDADVYIINYEGLKWLFESLPRRRSAAWPFDILCFDEVSKCKDSSTKRVKMLRACLHRFPRRWGLTGTPAPNSLLELFGQMLVIDGGRALGKYITYYREKYFYLPHANSYDWTLRTGAGDAIHKAIAPICHRLAAKDHLDMPERVSVYHPVYMGPKGMREYENMQKDLMTLVDGVQISAVNAAVLWGKLLQICQGFMYDSEKQAQHIHNAKMDVLEDIIEESAGQPVMVIYRFKEDLRRLKETFEDAVDLESDVEKRVEAWNRGEIPIILAQPQSAGHGLNMQAGGHIMVWYAMNPSLEQYIQACARLDRQGQKFPVMMHHLIASGTVDEEIVDVLAGRKTQQDALFSALKKLNAA